MKLQQIRYFVSAYEERSLTAAAHRENATQSGLSTHIKDLEYRIGAQLFERTPSGVTPTPVGERFYVHAVAVLRALSELEHEVGCLSREVTGTLRVGLMPSFTRSALAPVLDGFARTYPRVEIAVIEAYSAALVELAARAEIDFAIVPEAPVPPEVRAHRLARDDEYLVTRAGGGRPHLSPVRLDALGPLSLVVPTAANARRASIDRAIRESGAAVARLVELDAMMGTLDLVARSAFVAILPGVIVASDRDGALRSLHPVASPAMSLAYMRIEPATRALSRPARIFADALAGEIETVIGDMRRTVEAAASP